MKNFLKLHEAVAVILLSEPNRTATFALIAEKIDKRGLFSERKGGITLTDQIKIRTSISSPICTLGISLNSFNEISPSLL